MTRPRNRPRKHGPNTPRTRFARPRVEELEDRITPSLTPLGVAQQIVLSDEHFQNFVTQQYQTLLNRTPDPAGLAGWVQGMDHGLTEEQVEVGFVTSAEYVGAHGGLGAGWLSGLYHDLLAGRAPAQAELDAWQGQLAAGASPGQIALAFVTSPEREANLITQDYQQFLGRLPSAAEIALWQVGLGNGLNEAGLEADLIGSPEFYSHGGGTDAGFVTAAYQAVLNRTPSQAEVQSWLNALDGHTLITLNLNPLDINLLGLEIQTNQIQVTVSALPGDGQLLGNLLTTVSNLVNLQGVNNALNNVLGSVVTLLNSSSLSVAGVNTATGPLVTAAAATTPVLDLFVAPVHLDLLGALVDTSPIHLTITAHSGQGLILGNVAADLANLFNPPLPGTLNLDDVNTRLQGLIQLLDQQIPGIVSSTPTTPAAPAGTERVVSLTVPPIDLNLLGLVLKTSQIQVNADAVTGNGDLLGNVLTTLLNTLGATPQNLTTLSDNLNTLLGKVVGVLNASTLTLPANALSTLTQALQTLALPNLINATGTASAPILNLAIASTDGTTPPVNVNLLGLKVTTSNIQAQLLAQTGDGQILGNLLYNVANLLNPGGSLNLLTLLGQLGL